MLMSRLRTSAERPHAFTLICKRQLLGETSLFDLLQLNDVDGISNNVTRDSAELTNDIITEELRLDRQVFEFQDKSMNAAYYY